MSFSPKQIEPGVWTQIRNPYKVTCCGCGLSHVLHVRNDPDTPGEFDLKIEADDESTMEARGYVLLVPLIDAVKEAWAKRRAK